VKAYNIIIIFLIFLGTLESHAREIKSKLGRFAQGDSSYDYTSSRSGSVSPDIISEEDADLADLTDLPDSPDIQDVGGLIIKGFPEGCAYATLSEPLPNHILGYGRIDFMGSSFAFQYLDLSRRGAFQVAEVAQNLGLIGQNPEQNLSIDLMARTAQDRFVVAQLLDRSEFGLAPIVTCISPVFFGTLTPGREIIFGRDYWTNYDRFQHYRHDSRRYERYKRWKNRWQHEEDFDWRKHWRDKNWHKDSDKRPRPPVLRPRPKPAPEQTTRPKLRPRPKPVPDQTTKPVLRPRPKPEPDQTTKPELTPRPKPEPGQIKKPVLRPRPKPEPDQTPKPKPIHAGDKEETKIEIQIPDSDKIKKGHLDIELPTDRRGRQGKIHIQIPDDKGQKKEQSKK